VSRFGHVLRRAEARLEAPEPERSRILLEMARDLEDLYAVYRARGLSEGEAARRAESLLGASPEAMEALGGIHATGFQRLAARLAPGGGHRIEELLLLVLALGSAAVALSALVAAGVLRSPGMFHWILLGLGVAVVAATVVQTVGRSRPMLPVVSVVPLPALALAALVVSAFGAGMELLSMTATAGGAGAWELASVMVSVGRAAELLALALAMALVAVAGWFQVARRRREMESWRAEVAPLLEEPSQEETFS
jgi:hypothetical protein